MQGSVETMDIDPIFGSLGKEQLVVEQATVFLEDAVKYRSIHHKIDHRSLRIYKLYYSPLIRWGLTFVIILDLGLAFFEHPSSLTLSSDPRYRGPRPRVPCGALEVLEMLFLGCFVCDVIVKSHFLGRRQLIKNRWLLAYMLILVISFVDVFVSLSTGCNEIVRIRRLLRPFFLVQNSSLTKKLLRAIKRTLPEIMSVLFLLFLHLCFFTMFGMLLFPRHAWNVPTNSTESISHLCRQNSSDSGAICEGSRFFSSLAHSMRSLFVLLTTANNPDVMMPAYMKNRFYFIYFFLFTLIGLYCFLNLLTAVIYNQFRGYLMKSLESSLFRKRLGVRAAFEVLCTLNTTEENTHCENVPMETIKLVINKVNLGRRKKQILNDTLKRNTISTYNAKQFQDLFEVIDCPGRTKHRPPMSFVGNVVMRKVQILVSSHLYDYIGDFVAGVNVIFVSAMLDAQYDDSVESSHSALAAVNFFFVLYYLSEQSIKLWSLGWQRYISFKGNMYCWIVTLLLVLLEMVYLGLHGSPFGTSSSPKVDNSNHSLDYLLSIANLTRIINMLIIFRLLRVVPNIRAFSLIAETLMNLLRNLSPFAGLIVAIFYVFAVLGMILFPKVTDPTERCAIKTNQTNPCTTLSFDALEYYANNFDDFAASLVLLWDIMVVNNWHVFLKAYAELVNNWAQLYFLAWYLVSVIISLNLFVALILEAFVDQWETRQRRYRSASATLQTQEDVTKFHQMFKSALVEPQEVEILSELNSHEFLRLNISEIIID